MRKIFAISQVHLSPQSHAFFPPQWVLKLLELENDSASEHTYTKHWDSSETSKGFKSFKCSRATSSSLIPDWKSHIMPSLPVSKFPAPLSIHLHHSGWEMLFQQVPSGQRLAPGSDVLLRQPKMSEARTEISRSAVLLISCPSKTRWHQRTKDNEQRY